jgi:hypothetical protein
MRSALTRRVADRYHLVEGFMLAYHAQIGSRALFGCVDALFEIDDLGIQRCISLTQRIVERCLFSDSRSELLGFSIAVVGKPELGLKTEHGNY